MPRERCDLYDLCSKYDCVFGVCEESDKPDMFLASLDIRQCSPSEKVKITILASIDEKLSKLLDK